jgi:hypothetical protein
MAPLNISGRSIFDTGASIHLSEDRPVVGGGGSACGPACAKVLSRVRSGVAIARELLNLLAMSDRTVELLKTQNVELQASLAGGRFAVSGWRMHCQGKTRCMNGARTATNSGLRWHTLTSA